MFLELKCTSIISWLSSHPQQIFEAKIDNSLVSLYSYYASEISSGKCLILFLMQDCSFDFLESHQLRTVYFTSCGPLHPKVLYRATPSFGEDVVISIT